MGICLGEMGKKRCMIVGDRWDRVFFGVEMESVG